MTGQDRSAAQDREFRNYPVKVNGRIEWLTKAEYEEIQRGCQS